MAINSNKTTSVFSSFLQKNVVLFFSLFGPLSTTYLDKGNAIVIFLLFLLSFLIKVTIGKPFFLNYESRLVVFSYFLSSIVGIFSIQLYNSDLPSEYFQGVLLGRFATISGALLILLLCSDWISSATEKQLLLFLKCVFFSCCIFLFFAIWQLLSFRFGIYFPFESRSDMHGVPSFIKKVLPNRITSIAREPNFYAPLLMESLILSRVLLRGVRRKIIMSLLFLITVFTFSGGAYAHLVILLLFSLMMNASLNKIFSLKGVFFITSISLFFLGTIFYLASSDNIILDFIAAKANTESTGASSRSQIMSIIFDEWKGSNFLTLFFGHGMYSLGYLKQLTGHYSDFDFRISNNLYLDFLWECGILGLLFFIIPISLLFVILWNKRNRDIYSQSSLLFLASLLITCLYRSEYVTTHFVWSMIIMLTLSCLSRKKS